MFTQNGTDGDCEIPKYHPKGTFGIDPLSAKLMSDWMTRLPTGSKDNQF
jgi:hypothetical protein